MANQGGHPPWGDGRGGPGPGRAPHPHAAGGQGAQPPAPGHWGAQPQAGWPPPGSPQGQAQQPAQAAYQPPPARPAPAQQPAQVAYQQQPARSAQQQKQLAQAVYHPQPAWPAAQPPAPQPYHPQPAYQPQLAQPARDLGAALAAHERAAITRERIRFFLGLAVLVACVVLGVYLNVTQLLLPGLSVAKTRGAETTFYVAIVVAYIPVALYLAVPSLMDRYDPEPWWALAGIFVFGATFSTGVALVCNGFMGELFDKALAKHSLRNVLVDPLTAAISAPIFEELTKGAAILGMVVFLRREFDGMVDGVIYAVFVAIGFAATENVAYYLRGGLGAFGDDLGMRDIFVRRGLLTPWLHPLFTAMTGLGFGYAREHGARWAKVVFPLVGYGAAVCLHAWWNGMPFFAAILGNPRSQEEFVESVASSQTTNTIVGVLMVISFLGLLGYLVWRKGRNIRGCLQDEALIGTISPEDLKLICSPFGRLQALMSWRGAAGRRFIRAGSRLGLAKWHSLRAMRGQKRTVSMDFVAPLRQELKKARADMLARAPAGYPR